MPEIAKCGRWIATKTYSTFDLWAVHREGSEMNVYSNMSGDDARRLADRMNEQEAAMKARRLAEKEEWTAVSDAQREAEAKP